MKNTLQILTAFVMSLAIIIGGSQWANADEIEISDWHDLNDVRNDLEAEYVLLNDLDEDTDGYGDYNDEGWEPIGDADNRFMGSFDGQGYTIRGLTIDTEATWGGLFARAFQANIHDLSVLDADITSTDVGGIGVLAGELEVTDVENVTVSGTITSTGQNTLFGGLSGRQSAGNVRNVGSYVDINTEGRIVGGIYGQMTAGAVLEQAYYKGSITTDNPSDMNRWIGGINGQHGGGSMIYDSYAIADVKGTYRIGGIVGHHWRGGARVINSYFVGEVEGDQEWIDAFNDTTDADDQIEDIQVGGVVGYKDPPQDPQTDDDISMLINTFWDTDVSGLEDAYGDGEYHEDAEIAEGKTTDEMKDSDTFAEWNFDDIWAIDESVNEGYPFLQFEDVEDGYELTLNVDMSRVDEFEDAPEFDPDAHDVYVAGTFAGDWTQPGQDTDFMLEPSDDEDIYTITLTVEGGEHEYKYFLIEDEPDWDVGEWEGDPNRDIEVTGDKVVDNTFGDQEEVTSAEVITESEVPGEYQLEQNYPNPFNPSTNIEFTIPNNMDVRLDVYNSLGQRVATLVDDRLSAGTHTATFDASGLSSGTYIYRITAGSHVESRTMTFIK